MKYKTFGPEWHDRTPDGKPNFIWATKRYFNKISEDKKLMDSTIDQEFGNYINHVFRNINLVLPIDDYDTNEIESILKRILIYSGGKLDESTVKHTFTHLVYRPCIYYFNEFRKNDNPLWGSALMLDEDTEKGANALSILKRSFSENEERKLVKHLLKHPDTALGEEVGLATSFCNGVRENEACGFNYGDIVQMNLYPGEYILRLYQTTSLHSNILKSGGKTYNAPRLIPLLDAYKDFIFKRMDYLNSVLVFPIKDENGVFNNVLDLPLVCKGTNYTKRCKSDDLSKAGRILFRDVLKMREVDVALIDNERIQIENFDVVEKDVTTYAFRRNYATRCHNVLSRVEIEYLMGHKLSDIRYQRFDFVDEDFLHEMYNKLRNNPINSFYFGKI
ncbi:MAG: hypothetical protein IKE50_04305 [Erysipelotrichaceae bacterium]|nr:hypothetical protein [Erysipelotrichaceae bacterium]